MRITANPIPNIRTNHPLTDMDRLAAGRDTDPEQAPWPMLTLLVSSSLVTMLGILAFGGWAVWEVGQIAIRVVLP